MKETTDTIVPLGRGLKRCLAAVSDTPVKKILIAGVVTVAVLVGWRFTTRPISERYRDYVIIRWVTDGNPARREQIETFEDLHKNDEKPIHVVWDYGGDGMQKTMVQISGKRGPDLFDVYTPDVFYQFASSDALYDLTGLIEKDNERIRGVNRGRFERNLEFLRDRDVAAAPALETFPEIRGESLEEFGEYNRVAIDVNREFGVKGEGDGLELLEYPMTRDLFWPGKLDMITYEEKIYAVPTNTSGNVITYNREIFDRYGLPYPEDDWTTDEFDDIGRKLSVKEHGQDMYETFAFIPVWPASFVFAAGGGYFTPDRKGVIINEPAGTRGLAFVGNCYRERGGVRLSPTMSDSLAGSQNVTDWVVNFRSGRVAMVSAGRWILSITGPTFQYGYAPIPYFPGVSKEQRAVKMAARTTAISRDCLHPEAAFAFLRYLAGRDYGKILHQSGDGFSGVRYYAQEDWATFDPAFPEVASRMCHRIRTRLTEEAKEDPILVVTPEEAAARKRWREASSDEKDRMSIGERNRLRDLADLASGKMALRANIDDGLDPFTGLKENELNALAAVQWKMLPEKVKAENEKEVRAEMRMLIGALQEGHSEEFSPYIPSTSYKIAQDVLTQKVQRGTVRPEQWAPDLAKIFRDLLDQYLDPNRNRARYRAGNIIGWSLLGIVIVIAGLFANQRWRNRDQAFEGAKHLRGIEWKRERLAAIFFLSPNLLGFLVFTSMPVVFSFIIAFTNLNTLSEEISYAGFNHFSDLVTSGDFWYYFFNTIVFMLGLPLSVAASLALAVILNNRLQGNVAFRTVFYMPSVVSGVAIFLLWKWIFNKDYGLLNQAIRALTPLNPPGWLTDASHFLGIEFFWAKPALIFMGVWMAAGGPNMLLYLAGLTAIPSELYEAASIDGAGPWHRFRHVTWPLLSPTTFFIMIMGIIGGLQGGFEMAYIMTNGGPELSTTTMGYHIFQTAFMEFRMGAAAAAAWFLFVLVLGVTLVSWRYGNRAVHYSM